MEDKVYTNEEIEKEVQERVQFKLNDIQSAINNHISRNTMYTHGGIINLERKGMSQIEGLMGLMCLTRATEDSWKLLNALFKKESEMPTPYDEMYVERKRSQKNEAVDNIMERFNRLARGRIDPRQEESFIKMLVHNIEKAQR